MNPDDFLELGNELTDISVLAGGGNDEVFAPDIPYGIYDGEGGDDFIEGGNGHDLIIGGPGSDRLSGKGGDDLIGGGEDNDIIDGGEGSNALSGEKGDDHINGNKGNHIDGGEGNDVVIVHGIVTESGKLLNNFPLSLTNQKYFEADSSGMFIIDSSGIDTLSFANFDVGITLDLDLFNTQQIYTANNDTLTLNGIFENFIGSPFDDVIHINPLDVPRTIDGGGSVNGDTIYVETMGGTPTDDGTTITYSGYEAITYTNFTEIVFENTLSTDANLILPIGFYLAQNYPNPFNPTTTIHYTLPKESSVNITIQDMLGRKVYEFISQKQFTGNHSIQWNGKDIHGNPVSAGIYLYQIQAGDFVKTKKMVLMK